MRLCAAADHEYAGRSCSGRLQIAGHLLEILTALDLPDCVRSGCNPLDPGARAGCNKKQVNHRLCRWTPKV